MKTNNHVLSNVESDAHVPNLRQKRSASKNEDNKLKLLSTVKSCRVSSPSTETNVNNTKINITASTIITRNNSKTSLASKKNIKALSLNKTSSRFTRMSTTIETSSK